MSSIRVNGEGKGTARIPPERHLLIRAGRTRWAASYTPSVMATRRSSQVGPGARPVAIPDDVADTRMSKATGRVELPRHVRWSDPPVIYDMANRRDRISVYEQVLTEGTEDDVRSFIDVGQLVDLWDELVLSPHVRTAWETWLRDRGLLTKGC